MDLAGTKKLLYSIAKNYRKGNTERTHGIKDEEGENLLIEPSEIEERWKQYFTNLLNVPENIEDNEETVDDSIIAAEEVKSAIKNMKNRKAPGMMKYQQKYLKRWRK